MMIAPELPTNEIQRLKALKKLEILDTDPEKEFDDITEIAAHICNTPVALITLIDEDRQWFKSKKGTEICETDREISLCGHAINQPWDIMEVPDTRRDVRFIDNPVTQMDQPVIFYAGVPLTDSKGNSLGTVCVIDHKPNKISDHQKKMLLGLANQTVKLLELRTSNRKLNKSKKKLKSKNKLLRDFAGVVSHDMKMPLANMIITSDLLKKKYGEVLDEKGFEYLDNLKRSSLNLSDYITRILEHYQSDKTAKKKKNRSFYLHFLLEEVVDMFNIKENCVINFPTKSIILNSNQTALKQIFLNLIGNSLKYNDKEKIEISLDASEDENCYKFSVSDNGVGIPYDKQDRIFKLFSTLETTDRYGNKGNGIGLSTVKKLINKLGGKIYVESTPKVYTKFTFTIKKPKNLSQ